MEVTPAADWLCLMVSPDLLELVSSIYDAAFDPALWSATLVKITDAIGGAQAMMGVHDFKTRSLTAIAPRMDPGHMKSYAEHWGASDILWQRTNSAPVGSILLAEQFVTRDELKRTGIYNEWYRPMRLGASGLGVNLPAANGLPAVCGIKRLAGDDSFNSNEVAIFTALVPHLIRAAEINQRLWDLSLAEAFTQGEIDSRRQGVLVLDACQHIMYGNSIATDLLNPTNGLSVAAGALSTTDKHAADVLGRYVHGCIGAGAIRGGSLTLQRRNKSPLQLLVVPFPRGQRAMNTLWHQSGPPVAIVLIDDPERQAELRRKLLQSRYGLTLTEAHLALEIIKGDGRQAAAWRLGMSLGTARIHLQRIFHKTGAHRQAELVRIIGSLVADHVG